MAVLRPACERGQLGQHLRVAVDHAGEVHHLGQAEDRAVGEQGRQILRGERAAVGLHVGGRHARRRHDDHVERQIAAALGHEANARDAGHVGNFMGIGDDGGHTAGQHGRGKLGRRAEAAFDVHVRVDEAGSHVPPAQINGLRGAVAAADTHDPAVCHGDVGFFDCAGKDVDDAPVAQQQIRITIAACSGEQGSEFHTVLPELNQFRPL